MDRQPVVLVRQVRRGGEVMKWIKRMISWLLLPAWLVVAAVYVACSMRGSKYTPKVRSVMERFTEWNDRVLMGKSDAEVK